MRRRAEEQVADGVLRVAPAPTLTTVRQRGLRLSALDEAQRRAVQAATQPPAHDGGRPRNGGRRRRHGAAGGRG